MKEVRRLCVVTHRDPAVAAHAVDTLVSAAREREIELLCDRGEIEKHPALEGACVVVADAGDPISDCDAAIVLAGDGTLLRTLGRFARSIPVLGVNFGMLGFLSGAAHTEIQAAVYALADGKYRTAELPSLEIDIAGRGTATALNDVVASGGITGRVNELAWRIISSDGEITDEMGTVACDGMVLATPIGSTAYNLSNGGPVLAWGVEGTVVSFIAPHTLAARPLIVAPQDIVEIEHMGRGAALKVLADGRQVGRFGSGESLRVSYGPSQATLALVDRTSFYARYRENFAVQMLFHGPRVRASDSRRDS